MNLITQPSSIQKEISQRKTNISNNTQMSYFYSSQARIFFTAPEQHHKNDVYGLMYELICSEELRCSKGEVAR